MQDINGLACLQKQLRGAPQAWHVMKVAVSGSDYLARLWIQFVRWMIN